VSSAVIDGASEANEGDVRPEAITALCDVVATMITQHIDIRSMADRRMAADACRERILKRIRLIAESLDDQGATQVDDLFKANKLH
jgi:hypothetical protein